MQLEIELELGRSGCWAVAGAGARTGDGAAGATRDGELDWKAAVWARSMRRQRGSLPGVKGRQGGPSGAAGDSPGEMRQGEEWRAIRVTAVRGLLVAYDCGSCREPNSRIAVDGKMKSRAREGDLISRWLSPARCRPPSPGEHPPSLLRRDCPSFRRCSFLPALARELVPATLRASEVRQAGPTAWSDIPRAGELDKALTKLGGTRDNFRVGFIGRDA